MTTTTPYQNPQAEQWRLMTASERATMLDKAVDELANLCASNSLHTKEQAEKVFNHILSQAEHLDESQMLTGATGESNELYYQARGLTLVMAMDNAQKLPIIAQLLSALVTGNQVNLHVTGNEEFVVTLMETLFKAGVSKQVLAISSVANEEEYQAILSESRLAQIAVVGTVEEVQALSATVSKTGDILTQIIAITDQNAL